MRRLAFALLFSFATIPFCALAQEDNGEVRVSVVLNADGSRTVYETNATNHKTVATTTGKDGKLREKIRWDLDESGRFLRGGIFVIAYRQKGGLLMWPILICSIISIAVFAERLFCLHRATIHVGEFLKGLANLIKRRNFAEALHESAGTPGPVARVIHAAIIRHDLPRSELREIVQEAGQLEVPKLERFLGVLATLAYLAPLLGLLGTVAGMIEAFGVIASNGGYATVTELSGGIYKSLLTTAAGLVVATPTFVAYSYLSSRVNTLMHDMERAGIEIVQMLAETEPESGIISFQPTAEGSQRDLRREK